MHENWYSPAMIALGIAGICTFVTLVLCMIYKAVTAVSHKTKKQQYVDLHDEDYDTNNTWRDGQSSKEMTQLRFNKKEQDF